MHPLFILIGTPTNTKDNVENIIVAVPKDRVLMDKITKDFRDAAKLQMDARMNVQTVYNTFDKILS
jgi:hypothetical protein